MANHEAQLLNISRTSLLCSMCHERFKEPKLLECLHNFCQKCLATTTKSSGALGGSCSIQCPLCNKRTEIPNSNVANLKTNFPLVRLIDTIRVQEQVLQSESPVSKAVVCGTCDQKNKAVSRCHDCSMFLCRSCQTVHRRIAACSHHMVTLLDDLLSGKQTPVLKKQQGRAECIKHPGCKDRSDVYCETCKKQLCKECAVLKLDRGRHGMAGTCTSNHRHIRVETAAANKRSSIKNMISGLQQKLTDFKSTAKTIATSGPELDSRAAKLEQQVKNFANKARVDICIEEASLLKKISQIRQDQAKTLEDCGARINTAIDHIIDATEAAMEIVDNSEDGDFLMLWPLIEKGLHNQMSIRPSDIYQGLSHWTFEENRSINLGTLSDSSGYSYGKGMNTARQGLFDQMQRTMKNDTPFGAAVFPTKEGAASETGVFKDLIERFPPPPNGDISSSQQETSGKKTSGKMLKSQGKSCCREKSSTFDFGASASDSSAIFQLEHLSLWKFKTEMKDEEIMYKQQACMYRYETFSGIWKERGIGNIKLLRHKDRGVLRLIFQLEQESIVCANHYIDTLMKLEPLQSSRHLWLWRATDHSEGLSCNQQYAVKFKTSELAKEFKSQLEKLQAVRKGEEEQLQYTGAVGSGNLSWLGSNASGKGFTFAQAGAPVFGAATKEEDGEQESHEHDPHYEPIMSLPELSQVKTGEEEEEVMYKQRARLYRYAKELGVWKERGIGDVKLLRHKHSGVLRLIMRREQVLKLCANHRITTDMKLDPLHSSDRSWVWHAVDYSEDEPCHEQLAIRFKTSEQAHEFKRRLEELQAVRKEEEEREMEQKTEASGPQEEVGETKPEGEEIKREDSAGASDEPDQETTTEDNFAKFQPKEGDWKCEICWLNNGKGDMACVACMTPKPGAVSSTTAPASGTVNLLGATAQTGKASSSGGNLKFTFGSASGSSFAFGSSKSSDGTAKPSGFKFGGPVALSSATPLSTPRSSLSTETVKFGATQSNTTLTIAKESTQAKIAPTTKFTFGSGFQKFDFGGAGDKATKPKIPENSLSGGYTFDTVGAQKVDGAGAATLVAAASSEVQVTPVKPSTGFVFGAKSITPPTTKPSEAKPEAYLFADMVKPEGATFSFCLDVSKSLLMSSEKSPVKPKSPGLNKSPGFNKSGDSEYYKDDEGEEQLTPLKSSVGPSIGAKSVISMCTTKPSKEQHKQLSFADMAKVEGSAFSFRLDICKSLEMSSGVLPFKPRTLDYIQSVPIIKLPICIQIKTGEENETTKFSHRAQLYCFDKDSSQWKERGIGDIKLLYNPANGKYRIVMRREKVLKLCANHYVTPILNLQSNAASTKSWVWMAMDASDEEAQMKQLAVRFKAEEVALQFKKAVDAAKKDIMAEKGGQTDEKKDDKEEVGDEAIERQDKEEGPDDSLGERGDIDQQEGDSDGNEDVDNDDDNDEDVDETEEEEGEDQGEHDEEEERQEAVEEGDANLSIVKSCDPNISKAFSELLRTSITSHAEELKLGVETPTTSTSSTSKHGDAGESSKDDSISEERDDIHCEAVAQLPKQVDVITGEEDETELFCSRAKLYRFDKAAAQWKDRGIGDIKILGNTTMKRYRVIMRRDQVLKLCANHYITAEMTLEPNAGSENSLVWQAMDASEGDPQMEELAVRFKLAGTTQRFKTVFEECQAELRKQRQQDDGVSSTSVESQGASVKEQKDESRDDEKASSSPTSETEKPSSESSSTSESSKTESEN